MEKAKQYAERIKMINESNQKNSMKHHVLIDSSHRVFNDSQVIGKTGELGTNMNKPAPKTQFYYS